METKPNVLIMIATDIIGGPGKGLFQFLRYADALAFKYVLCNFHPTFINNVDFEFHKKAKEEGINFQPLKQNMKIDPLLIWRAYRISKKYRINIIQTHGYKSNVIGFFLNKIYNIPWIGFTHGYTEENLKVKLYNKLDSFVLRFADKAVTVSNSMKKILVDTGIKGSKITVIKNAIDQNELIPDRTPQDLISSLDLKKGELVIGVVGRLNPEKGQLIFLKAFEEMIKEIPNIKAIIIGDGQDKERLYNYCESNNLNSRVIFAGYQRNIVNYYQIMDVLVIPSYSEGLPNVLLEVMAFGIPVVATSVGGITEVLNGTNGILIPPDNPEVMSIEVLSLLRDKARRNKIKEEAKKNIVSSFSPELRAQKIVDLYYETLRN